MGWGIRFESDVYALTPNADPRMSVWGDVFSMGIVFFQLMIGQVPNGEVMGVLQTSGKSEQELCWNSWSWAIWLCQFGVPKREPPPRWVISDQCDPFWDLRFVFSVRLLCQVDFGWFWHFCQDKAAGIALNLPWQRFPPQMLQLAALVASMTHREMQYRPSAAAALTLERSGQVGPVGRRLQVSKEATFPWWTSNGETPTNTNHELDGIEKHVECGAHLSTLSFSLSLYLPTYLPS